MQSQPIIDLIKIQSDLQEDAGYIKVKVVKGTGARVAIRETDKGVHIALNPKRITTQAELDRAIHHCRTSVMWDNQI